MDNAKGQEALERLRKELEEVPCAVFAQGIFLKICEKVLDIPRNSWYNTDS